MNAPAPAELAAIKQGARATWAAGDYPAIARRQLWEVGPRIVRAAGVRAGDDVLDVACGTGNAALRAAQAGGRVTGLDLTPELFDTARRLAADAGVQVEWVEGDAEELPFDDESFDVVLSTFGCMFAPRHELAANELARVLRPGGRLAFTAWTPEGGVGRSFRTVGAYLPAPPALAQSPLLWGAEEHVEALFEGTGVELRFERGLVTAQPFDSAEAEIEYLSANFGPMMMAREVTEASGRWRELRAELLELYERDDPPEYLLTRGTKRP